MERLRAYLRILWAITAKDVMEGIRNKNAIGVILSALFVVIMYRFLPLLTGADEQLRVLVHDAGISAIVPVLEDSPALRVYRLSSQEKVAQALAEDGDLTKIGLVIPADYDEGVAKGDEPTLTGYVMRWASESQARDALHAIEGEIAAETGISVKIEERRVDLLPDGVGGGLMPAMGMVFVSLMVGMMVPTHLMLEEKRSKTLEALLVSPATASHVVLGKALAGMVYVFLGVAAAFALNQALINHWWLAMLTLVVAAGFCVGTGLLFGSMTESRHQVMLWAWVVLVPLLIPVFLSIMDDIVPATLVVVFRYIPTVALFHLFRISFAGAINVGDWAPHLLLVLGWNALVLALVVGIVNRSDR